MLHVKSGITSKDLSLFFKETFLSILTEEKFFLLLSSGMEIINANAGILFFQQGIPLEQREHALNCAYYIEIKEKLESEKRERETNGNELKALLGLL
jgi:hypothetical protein